MTEKMKELILKALEAVDEAYNETEYNTKECNNLLETKNLLDDLLV